jgi:hypothetical protein
MYTSKISREISKSRKKFEIDRWKFDIDSYHCYKNMIKLYEKLNRDTTFVETQLQKIRDRWPNVKNWD